VLEVGGHLYCGFRSAAEELTTMRQHDIKTTIAVGDWPQPARSQTAKIRDYSVHTTRPHQSILNERVPEELSRFVPKVLGLVDEWMPKGGVLVYCHDDDDESAVAAIAVAFYMTRRNVPCAEAIARTRQARPSLKLSDTYRAQLYEWADLLASDDVPKWLLPKGPPEKREEVTVPSE